MSNWPTEVTSNWLSGMNSHKNSGSQLEQTVTQPWLPLRQHQQHDWDLTTWATRGDEGGQADMTHTMFTCENHAMCLASCGTYETN